jgi:hypothetical protein
MSKDKGRIYAVTITTPSVMMTTVYVRAADAGEAKDAAALFIENDPCAVSWEDQAPDYESFEVECHGETEDQDVEPDCEAT